MRLARASSGGAFIPLTPLVDVMLILLVFFMVTSTFLDLDMIPMAGQAQEDPLPQAGDAPAPAAGGTMLIRLRADGLAQYRGQALGPAALEAQIADRLASAPATRVVILPSGAATAQALVNVTEAATRAGATDLGILRLEGAQ